MSEAQSQLNALSKHLGERREKLLSRCLEAIRKDPQVPSSTGLPRPILEDHLPVILSDFERRLQAEHPLRAMQVDMQQREDAAEHGRHRWQQGFDIRETMHEWGHLHLVLLDELERYAAAHPDLEREVMVTARRALSQLCMDGNCESAFRYMRMQQAEAANRVHDLESSLRALQALENERAELLRETAHDLRGGMGVIASTAAILAKPNIEGPERDRFYNSLQRRINATAGLLTDLAELARIEAGQVTLNIEAFDAPERVREFCETLRPVAAARNLFLKYEGLTSLPVEGDVLKLQRVAQNLLLNALQVTQTGGVVVRCLADKEVSPQHWTLSVEDTGPGFALQAAGELRHALKRATEEAQKTEDREAPTVQRASSGPGSSELPSGEGIGLSIVKRLCTVMGASVDLETAPGYGTTFRITFPVRYS